MRRRFLALALVSLGLSGCPALYVDRGELVTPSGTLDRPAASELPKARDAVAIEQRWRRETHFGLGDQITATLVDPRVAAARVVHEAAAQPQPAAALDAALADRWNALYGAARDRFPIDVDWRFDAQFVAHAEVLDPANWAIALDTDRGTHSAPMATSVLASTKSPQDGYWEGRVRLWFPWRDPASGERLLGAGTGSVTLGFTHPSGTGSLIWRFHASR